MQACCRPEFMIQPAASRHVEVTRHNDKSIGWNVMHDLGNLTELPSFYFRVWISGRPRRGVVRCKMSIEYNNILVIETQHRLKHPFCLMPFGGM
jgi:hypothetical protein